jgi:peroxiredoxin
LVRQSRLLDVRLSGPVLQPHMHKLKSCVCAVSDMDAEDSRGAVAIPDVGDVVPRFSLLGVDGQIDLDSCDTYDFTVLTFLQDTVADNALSLIGMVESVKASLESERARFICVLTEPLTTLDTFREEFDITLELASDFDRVVTKAYGVLSEKQGAFTAVPRECVFVLDRKLKVVYRWISLTTQELPVLQEMEDTIRSLILGL